MLVSQRVIWTELIHHECKIQLWSVWRIFFTSCSHVQNLGLLVTSGGQSIDSDWNLPNVIGLTMETTMPRKRSKRHFWRGWGHYAFAAHQGVNEVSWMHETRNQTWSSGNQTWLAGRSPKPWRLIISWENHRTKREIFKLCYNVWWHQRVAVSPQILGLWRRWPSFTNHTLLNTKVAGLKQN